MNISIVQYAKDSNTINLFPKEIYDEDLNPECGIQIDEICTEIYEACKGWGKDEKRLAKALGNTIGEDRRKIAIRFPEMYDMTLTQLMNKNFSKYSDLGDAVKFLSVGPIEAECMMLKKAMDGWGCDDIMLYSILCGRSNEDITLLKKTYYKMYLEDLTSRVRSKCSGDLKAFVMAACQGAEEEFDPDYHNEEKAMEDSKVLHKACTGFWGADETAMAKILVMSPPKYLKILNSVYADKYGYTLMKAFEKELNSKGGDAAKFAVGMKLKPFDTMSMLIKKATRGLGTNEVLLTSCLIRYQDLLSMVYVAHEVLFEKSIHTRIRDETSGAYKTILLALVDKVYTEL